MDRPDRPLRSAVIPMVIVAVLLVAVAVGARVLGSRSTDDSAARTAERERTDGFVNHLQVVNMLDVPIRLAITDVDPAEWGRIAPDDEPPAGMEAEVIEPQRVGDDAALRPLRIADGGGSATFTIGVLLDDPQGTRRVIGTVPTRSNSLEYCAANGQCFDGYGWFDWSDTAEPQLDVFRTCVEDDRVIGTITDAAGASRDVHALFQCNAATFHSSLVIHD